MMLSKIMANGRLMLMALMAYLLYLRLDYVLCGNLKSQVRAEYISKVKKRTGIYILRR